MPNTHPGVSSTRPGVSNTLSPKEVLFDDVGWCTGKVITKLERDEWTVRFDDDDEDEIQ